MRDPLDTVLILAGFVFAMSAVAALALAGERWRDRYQERRGRDLDVVDVGDQDDDLMTAVVCARCERVFEDDRRGQWQPIGPLHAQWLCHGCAALVRRSGEWSLP